MRIITEEIEDVEVITESIGGKKSFWIQGPFLQGDVKNRNGRIYESRILAREVKRYNEQLIKNNRALGELGHPDGPSVNLDRVSHKITQLEQDGSNFIGKAKIIDTPMGRIASALLSDGVMLGVSSRGMGSLVERSGVKYVGEDFTLATAADIVADPSAPDAFVNGIYEGVEWYYDTEGKLRMAEAAKVQVEKLSRSRQLDESSMLRVFERYLAGL